MAVPGKGSTRVDADLSFSLEREGRTPITGRLTGADNELVLEVSDPGAFAGAGDAAGIRALAETLAERGVRVRVEHDHTHLVSLGAVRAPWWQRRATGSRRIRLGSLRGAWTAARSRVGDREAVLPSSSTLPPATLWPIAPTFSPRSRRRVTTTHDPGRGGSARLVLEKEAMWGGEKQQVFWLEDGLSIGSHPESGIVLPGTEERHAVLHHDEHDEWVVVAVDGATRVHGARVERQILRTGARIQVGDRTLAFRRDEHADHGRPYYGRVGGELGRQVPQPPRPGPRPAGEWTGSLAVRDPDTGADPGGSTPVGRAVGRVGRPSGSDLLVGELLVDEGVADEHDRDRHDQADAAERAHRRS